MTVKRRYLIPAVAIALLHMLPVQAAEQKTGEAIIPWEAKGRVFKVDTETIMFLGAFKGIMYIESSKGDLHEAFVMCPIVQRLAIETGMGEATGHCEITASPEDVAYAEMKCTGKVGGCTGTFKLVDGLGKFAGISGSGKLRVRSPMQALAKDMAAGADLRVGAGLAVIKDLKIRLP